MNGVMIQFFHWYHPGNLWKEFIEKADYLKQLGCTAVWFPPATKCSLGTDGRGYDVYDLYDLGEFDQKGGVATRYGTKEEYLNAIGKAHEMGMSVYADLVLNHRMGADEEETFTVHQVDEENRNEKISEGFETSAKTKFTFPGRNGKYSDFVWDYHCFSGIDYITVDGEEKNGIFKIHHAAGEEWTNDVSHQLGNYDYLMGADVEYRNSQVVEEMKKWIKWYVDTTQIDGMRLDALKHISSDFLHEWICYIKNEINPDCYILGEFWKSEADKIEVFSDKMDNLISCFDAPLHYNFFKASEEGSRYDLRQIFRGSFQERQPLFSVSFVDNHDTQQLQSLESTVQDWFKPIAYAIILLSESAYPCVFYPDLFGAEYTDVRDGEEVNIVMPKVEILPQLMEARKKFAHGGQENYLDDANCIAIIRRGRGELEGCVVVISNSENSKKRIDLGDHNANQEYIDFLGNQNNTVKTDQWGVGVFTVAARCVSVWVRIKKI